MIHRGQIYYAQLEEGVGSEQEGHRPVLVVQNDVGNLRSRTIIVIPITSQIKNMLPTHVELGRNYGLFLESTALAEQILTLDRARFGDYIGTVDDMKMLEVDQALKVSLDLLE
ncbi:type II toxin-antitoxin system PemK/MazF family toxin [Ruminococcus sp. FC2018]|uniref:type II toxin-antitoxin system PemK/MazF family toxin n=1 Tax=Ruminococcus sp. FC2018 TaxID=1410617 RepID=UPI000490D062|nr:type II toxin-antitoxin system PemK/MazF family toxin [Ruminococcus sp. FC2018]